MDTLSFIARQFDIEENRLHWGIMKENEDYSICVLIDGTSNFIDVVAGRFRTPINVRGVALSAMPADIYDLGSGRYQLAADFNGIRILQEFTKKSIEDLYKNKRYYKGMEEEVFF